MKKGEIIEDVDIVDVGVKGKSIGKKNQFVIFTDKAVPGDIVDLQMLGKRKGIAEGKILAYKKYSANRIQPVCQHFYTCGGCSWQNMSYETQLEHKQKAVLDTLQRIAKITAKEVLPIAGSARTEYYRNRLDFAFSNARWLSGDEMQNEGIAMEKNALGFHIPGRFDKVLDIKRCYLQIIPSNQIRLAIREYALRNKLPFFDYKKNEGLLRSLIIRTTTTGELMVIVVFYRNDKDEIGGLLKYIKHRFERITSLYYVINPKANDTTYDLEHHLYEGRAYLIESLNGLKYRIGVQSFFQTNPYQAETLFRLVKQLAGLKGDETVYDLYTGVGSIALYIADKALKVIGIETIEEAIDFARENARENNITNAEFFAGDVKKIFTDTFIAQNGRPDVIITDPPRVGMDKEVVDQIARLAPGRIVYVSCNPATQARDIEWLSNDYEVRTIQPVDMFPHTYHVENIAVLERKI